MNTLVILAAGLGSRFGGQKQLVVFGSLKRTLMEYNLFHAFEAGFRKVVFVIQPGSQPLFSELLARLPIKLMVEFAEQSNSDLPAACNSLFDTDKPLGTAHAIWCARNHLVGRFAVINGDDYYGEMAFQKLIKKAKDTNLRQNGQQAMVGFQLEKTLSEFGGVNRGICQSDYDSDQKQRRLTGIEECFNIVRDGTTITGDFEKNESKDLADSQLSQTLRGDSLASMNCWLFERSFIHTIEQTLIMELNNATEFKECYLPNVVMSQISQSDVYYELLESIDSWFGLTFSQDQDNVEKMIQQLIEQGVFNTRVSVT